MKHIGLVRSRVNKRPIQYEMKTLSCKWGLSFQGCVFEVFVFKVVVFKVFVFKVLGLVLSFPNTPYFDPFSLF